MAQTQIALLVLQDKKVTWFWDVIWIHPRAVIGWGCCILKNSFAYEGRAEIAHTCFFFPLFFFFFFFYFFFLFFSSPLLSAIPPFPSSAESHYRNTISNTSAQVFDRLQTNLYSGGKQKAAEIYLLSVEERNKLAREPWVTSELTWRWISARYKCMERRDISHSVIQHIAACRIPLTPTAGTIFLCCKNAVRSCSLRWIIL